MLGFSGDLVQVSTITTDGSITSAFDIRGANQIAIEVQTFSVGLIAATANVKFQVSNSATGTYRPLYADGVYSSNSGLQEVEISSSNGNFTVTCPFLVGYSYMKVQLSKTATATIEVKVHSLN